MTTLIRPRSLVWRLGLSLVALNLIVVIIVAFRVAQTLSDFNKEQSLRSLADIAAVLSDRYTSAIAQNSDAAMIQLFVDHDRADSDVRITIILPDGSVLADSHVDPAIMGNHAQRPEVVAAIESGDGMSERISDSLDQSLMYYARRLDDEAGLVAVFRVAMSTAQVDAGRRNVLRSMVLALVVSALITIVFIIVISRWIGRSVREVASGAARFGSGDLTHRLPIPSIDELSELARVLNTMAEQLEDQIGLLNAQRSEQQAILRSMSNGVIALDNDQHVLNVNRAASRMLGIPSHSSEPRPLLQEVSRHPELQQFVEASIAASDTTRGEIQIHEQYPPRTLEVQSEPLLDASDHATGILIVLNDVTELRRLEMIRSEFAANVSHELRTPITNILGYVELLDGDGFDDKERSHRYLDIINTNAGRLGAIIEDLLALARMESHDVQESFAAGDVSLSPILDVVVEQFRAIAGAKKIQINARVPEELEIHGVTQLLEQAFSNLVSNAIKYSPAETSIEITAALAEGGMVVVSVHDEGPGIAPEHQARLFERFYRVDKARSRAMGGTGLGLSIVKHIAQVHGGRVEVESEAGHGSTFRIFLRRAGADA